MLLSSYNTRAVVEITSTNMPSVIEENTLLELSFYAVSDINTSITYAVFKDGIKVSDTNSYNEFFNYSTAGDYSFQIFASDNESSVTENYTLTVENVPLEVSIISPTNRIYSKRSLNVSVSTTIPASRCEYDLNDSQYGNLSTVNNTSFYSNLNMPGDGKYFIRINCSDQFDVAGQEIEFTIDTSTPIITSKSYSITEYYDVILNAITDDISTCKYDTSNKNFESMQYYFDVTNSLQHTTKIASVADGVYDYYIRCKNNLNNTMNYSEVISVIVNQKPSAIITIDGDSPLKSGTYQVTVKTSKPVINSPVLFYTFNNDNTQRTISLTGSFTDWSGYMILDETTPNKVGTFHFSGTDFFGITGTLITSGELFLVDTLKPSAVSSAEAKGLDDGNIELRWYYGDDDATKFRIYKSTSENVNYVDYYATVDKSTDVTQDYIDTSVDSGVTYYYKISALDRAGNEGPLSDIVSAMAAADSAHNTDSVPVQEKKLSTELGPKVDDAILEIQKMLMDVQSRKNDVDKITDNSQLKVISYFKLSDKINSAVDGLNGIISEMTDLKNQDFTSSELDVRLNKLRLDAIKYESVVVEDIQIDQATNFEQITQESDVEDAISSVLENTNISKDLLENYSLANKRLQDSLTIKAESMGFRIKFMGKDDYDKYTIIKKSIMSSSPLSDVVLIESIPKDVEKKASNIVFDLLNQKYPVILKEDPILKWSYDNLSSTDIYYQVNDMVDISAIKNTRTVILQKPNFKFTDTIDTKLSKDAKLTGFIPFETVNISKLSFIQWLIIIGTGLIICLSVYYVVLNNDGANKTMSYVQNDRRKIISSTVSNAGTLRTGGVGVVNNVISRSRASIPNTGTSRINSH